MLRASSLGCWPAQSQECRAMLIRAMSSGMKFALSPNQPSPLLDGSAAKSSGSGRMKSKNERGMSGDRTAKKDHNQSSIQALEAPHVGIHGKTTPKDTTTSGSRTPRRRAPDLYVNPTAFVLPPPALRKLPVTPGHFSREAARKEGLKPSERIRRIPRKPKSIPRTNIRPPAFVVAPSPRKPPLSVNSVDGEAACKDTIFSRGPHTVSHNAPCVSLSGELTTTGTTTPAKAPKSRATRTRQTVAKSRTKVVKSNSSTAKSLSGELTTTGTTTPAKAPKSRVTRTRQTVAKSRTKAVEPNSSTAKTQEEEKLYITAESPHPVGRTWRPLPVKPISVPPLSPPFSENDQVQRSWFILHETTSVDDAWNAYTTLNEYTVPVPLAALHRMVRLVARERPRASTEYTRLLEIIKRVRPAGGKVYLHEWNALIDAAGRGWRKTTVRHFEMALSFFRDMTKGRVPGNTLALDFGSGNVEDETTAEPVEPDIYTYTTLLGIAARTKDPRCLRHARMLLERSGIAPNRFTHLALIPYFSATSQPGAVRSTLITLEGDRMELGLDGINVLLSAYSRNRRLDVVTMIYRLLKHNLTPDPKDVENGTERLEEYRRQLRTEEFIVVPDYLVPNEVTYTSLIQIMAYHGHLSAALMIFTDMLTAPNTERGAFLTRDADGVPKPLPYQPTAAIFRALFLGFRRHAKPLKDDAAPVLKQDANSTNKWTLSNLQQVFDLLMSMPSAMQVGSSTFYWLIVAFQTTSGNDRELVRDVWRQVEGRFRSSLGGRNHRLRRIKGSLFPEET